LSTVRRLFRHPLEWFVVTLVIGLVYGTAVLIALAFGRSLHLLLHSTVIAVLLISAISAAVGIYVEWLDRRADRRAERADRRAEERAHWTVRYLRENWPTQQLPTLRAVGSNDPTKVSLPAQANRERRAASVTRLPSSDRVLSYLEGVLAQNEVTGEVYPPEPDEEAT
jgi:hypothetical protein